jgi:hypothetical protein
MVSRSGSRPPRVSIQRVTGGRSRSARSAASRSRSRSPRGAVRYWPRKASAQASGSCRGSTGCGIGEIAVLAEDGARSLDVGPRSGRLVLCAISGSSVGRAGDACLSSTAGVVSTAATTPACVGGAALCRVSGTVWLLAGSAHGGARAERVTSLLGPVADSVPARGSQARPGRSRLPPAQGAPRPDLHPRLLEGGR